MTSPSASVGDGFAMKDGKKIYKQLLRHCHGEIAVADAVLSLTANQAKSVSDGLHSQLRA